LLRAINRLHDISEGEILLDDVDITKSKGKALRQQRRNIAMIFQNFNLVKRATVARNVLAGRVGYYSTFRSTFGLFSKEDKEKAAMNLDRVNMLDQSPHVVLADEPIASLDPKTTKMVMDDLQHLNDMGMTVVVNLHSVELAMAYATRIIGLRAGKLVYDKPIDQVNEHDFDDIYAESGDEE
jgi:phosphonate transport system ATP-binding protein